jgi:hypothetical protein
MEQKIYVIIGFLILVIALAIFGKNNKQQDLTNVFPEIIPGEINSPNLVSPGQIIAGPLMSPDGSIIYILENGEVREIM